MELDRIKCPSLITFILASPQPLFHDHDPHLGTVYFYSRLLSGIDWFSISMVSASNLGDEIISEYSSSYLLPSVSRLFDDFMAHLPPMTSWRASRCCFVSKDLWRPLRDLCLVSSSRFAFPNGWHRVPACTISSFHFVR